MNPLVTIEELMSMDFPEQKWLADKLIPAGAITILSGPPASYKTWVILHMALCVAKGEPLFGEFKTNQGGVLVIDEENGQRLLQERLYMLSATADLPVFFTEQPGFVLNDKNVALALRNCKAHSIKLIIIDSLVRVHASDENSSGDMSAVFKQLKRFATKGITVLVTHHNRKPGVNSGGVSNEMRGSSDILASVDCHIGMKRKDKILTLHQTKNRYAEELEPFAVLATTDEDSFSFEYQGQLRASEDKNQVIKDAVLQLLGEHDKLFQKELLSRLAELGAKTNEHKLRELLNEMVADKTIAETPGAGKTKYYSLSEEVSDD